MNTKAYASSPRVMFSDKGSTYFGIGLIVLMISLSFVFLGLKFKKPSQGLHVRNKTVKLSKKKFKLQSIKSKQLLLLHYPQKLSSQSIKPVKLREQNK